MDFGRVTAIIHTSSEKAMPPSSTVVPRSLWHSPVPYLFGGLAAMLALIAFALIMLGCSHWRGEGDERDLEAGEGTENGDEDDYEMKKMARPVFYEEKFLVILAGQQNPTCLATPIYSKTPSSGGTISGFCTCNQEDKMKEEESKQNPSQVDSTNQATDQSQE